MRKLAVVSILAVLSVMALLWTATAREGEELAPPVKALVDQAGGLPVWQHAQLIQTLRGRLDDRLLTPSPRDTGPYAGLIGGKEAGVNRILHRGRYEGDTKVRGGGAYFSFTSRTNDYDKGPDIALEQKRLSSGFYGGCFGFVVKLDSSTNVLSTQLAQVPAWLLQDPEKIQRRRRDRPEAVVGGVYIVRSVRERKADTLAVIEILSMDDDGATFAWRILKRNPIWSRPRRR
jgi:hypothetical protein